MENVVLRNHPVHSPFVRQHDIMGRDWVDLSRSKDQPYLQDMDALAAPSDASLIDRIVDHYFKQIPNYFDKRKDELPKGYILHDYTSSDKPFIHEHYAKKDYTPLNIKENESTEKIREDETVYSFSPQFNGEAFDFNYTKVIETKLDGGIGGESLLLMPFRKGDDLNTRAYIFYTGEANEVFIKKILKKNVEESATMIASGLMTEAQLRLYFLQLILDWALPKCESLEIEWSKTFDRVRIKHLDPFGIKKEKTQTTPELTHFERNTIDALIANARNALVFLAQGYHQKAKLNFFNIYNICTAIILTGLLIHFLCTDSLWLKNFIIYIFMVENLFLFLLGPFICSKAITIVKKSLQDFQKKQSEIFDESLYIPQTFYDLSNLLHKITLISCINLGLALSWMILFAVLLNEQISKWTELKNLDTGKF
jgi:hypothetical protein